MYDVFVSLFGIYVCKFKNKTIIYQEYNSCRVFGIVSFFVPVKETM